MFLSKVFEHLPRPHISPLWSSQTNICDMGACIFLRDVYILRCDSSVDGLSARDAFPGNTEIVSSEDIVWIDIFVENTSVFTEI